MSARRATGGVQRHRSAEGLGGPGPLRYAAAAGVVVLVLGAGLFLALGDLLGQRDNAQAGAISMRISMGGYNPAVLTATPGQTLMVDWWNTDNAMHLDGGIHTLVAPTLGISETLAAESRRTIEITAPNTPGDYDFWCDSCCGGKANPQMHGVLRVRAT